MPRQPRLHCLDTLFAHFLVSATLDILSTDADCYTIAWIRDAEEADLVPDDALINLPGGPGAAFVAQHHYDTSSQRDPHLANYHKEDDGIPFALTSRLLQPPRTSRWLTFAQASSYPCEYAHTEKVDPEWLDEHLTDYSKPWLADHNEDDVEDGSSGYHAFRKKRKVWYKRSQITMLRNPFVPLAFRLTVLSFSIAALAIGGSIHHLSYKNHLRQGPSAELAIIVDAIAILYIMYVTNDEYRSKPLGLRRARAKVRIVLLDLVFICFQSANLSLAFQSLSNSGQACKGEKTNVGICNRQRALASVILVALVAWLTTFTVSIFR